MDSLSLQRRNWAEIRKGCTDQEAFADHPDTVPKCAGDSARDGKTPQVTLSQQEC
jgi:hypothetical protein